MPPWQWKRPISDGGILVCVAEMALAGHIGATIQVPEGGPGDGPGDGKGDDAPSPRLAVREDQGRYIVTTQDPDGLLEAAEKAGVPAMRIGITGGEGLSLLGGEGETALGVLRDANRRWLRDYMAAP